MAPFLLLALAFLCIGAEAAEECEPQEPLAEEKVSLLQSREAVSQHQNVKIVVKGPSASGGTPAEKLAPTCAEGFNAAYAKCLGDQNSYLMIMVTDAEKAYCAYTGGWAMTVDNYPDHAACFASPGQSQALFYDSSQQSLMTWEKNVVVTGVTQDYTSLSCSSPGDAPCKATVQMPQRVLTKHGKVWQDVPAGGEFHFTWSSSEGYIGVTTTIPSEQKQYSMYVKSNLGPSSSNGLSADVPCGREGSVDFQAQNFPVNGLSGSCQKDNDDYWMAFGQGTVTICFPGVACWDGWKCQQQLRGLRPTSWLESGGAVACWCYKNIRCTEDLLGLENFG